MTNRIGVLGPVEITTADRSPVDTGGKRQRRLLAALALHAGDVVSVDALVDIVFEGNPSDAAEKTLQSYVSRLRRAVDGEAHTGASAIERVEPGYVIRLSDTELDADWFETQVAAARDFALDGDHAEAVRTFDAALRTWRGSPYAEFADEEWAMAESHRLLEIRAAAIEDRAESQLALGGHAGVVADLERFTLEEPTRERPRAQLMVALYRSGRQADALRAYHDYFALMREEMGLEPSKALRELEVRILAADPALDLGAVAGETLRGYRLFEELGRGAFSVVRRGTQPSVGRDVAVKAIRAELANDPDFVRRFETEAHMVANLEHPHIVPLYDYWREPDGAYLVMRWLRGGTLQDQLATGPLDLATAATLVSHVGQALDAAHRQGIVHRDIKPANVFCDDEGNFYLGDFGIAVGDTADPEAFVHATTAPAFASPELLERHPAGPSADIYSLGVTVFAALSGTAPFADAASDEELIHRQIHEPLPPVSSIRAGIPASVDEVVGRATAKSAMGRYGSAREFVAAFDAAVDPSGTRSVAPSTPAVEPGPNPYKGLRAFHEADAADFFGRSDLVGELIDVLRRDGSAGRLATLVGPSGSGKSSVVRAGLVPALREGAITGSADWFVATVMPGTSPFAELEAALLRIAVNPPASLLDQLADGPHGIGRAVKRVLPSDDTELLIILDQAEELFTLTTDGDEAAAFIGGLLAAVDDPHSRLRVVATIRADFYDRPLADPRVAGRVKTSTVIVTPMAPEELAEAIALPARRAGAVFEDGLVARITADVADQPGTLPLLQYTLAELYDAGHGHLGHDQYEALGGAAGALAGRAEAIFQELAPTAQEGARRLFARLVTIGDDTEDTRRRVPLTELGADPAVADAVAAYGDSRLLTFDRDADSREPTLEVAHEALIREWPRFRQWVDDDRDGLRIHRHLTAATSAWAAKDEDDAEVYRGSRLDSALGWSELHRDHLNELERRFLDASGRRRDEDEAKARQNTRRLRRSLVAVATVALLAMVAGVLAFRQQRLAEAALRDRDTAETAASKVEADALELETDLSARRLVDFSMGTDDISLAVLLATEANRLRPGSPEALGALMNALVKEDNRIDVIEDATWLARAASDDRLVAFEDDGLTIRSAERPTVVLDTFDLAPGSRLVPTVPAFSPDKGRVAVGNDSGVRIVDLTTGDVGNMAMGRGTSRGAETSALYWTADDHLVLADDPLRIYHVDELDATLVQEIPGVASFLPGAPLFMAPHPSEPLLAVGNVSGGLEVWDVQALVEGRVEAIARYPLNETIWTPTWSGDGSELLAANLFAPELWRIAGPDERTKADIPDFLGGGPFSVHPLSDGALFLAAGDRSAIIDRNGEVEAEWAPPGDLMVVNVVELGADRLAVTRTAIPSGSPTRTEIWSRGAGRDVLTRVLPEFGDLSDGQTVLLLEEEELAAVMRPIRGTALQIHESQVDEVWDLSAPQPRRVDLEGDYASGPLRLHRTAEGPVVLGMEDGRLIRVHDARSGSVLAEFPVDHPEEYQNLYISSDRSKISVLTASMGRLTQYDFPTGEPGRVVEFDQNATWLIRNEAENRGVISMTAPPSRIFDLTTLEMVGDLDGSFVFPSDSWRYVVLRPTDSTEIVVREFESGEETRIQNPTALLARLNPSEDYVIGWDPRPSPNGGLQWFDASTGEPIGHRVEGPVADLHFDGAAVTQVIDGRVHVWNTDPASWFESACEVAGRQLTIAEWQLYMPTGMDYDPVCTS